MPPPLLELLPPDEELLPPDDELLPPDELEEPEEPDEPERELLAEGEPPPELGEPPLELEDGEDEGIDELEELELLCCVSQALKVRHNTATAKALRWPKGGRLCMTTYPAAATAAMKGDGTTAPLGSAQDTKQITHGPSGLKDFAAAIRGIA